jgi:hypothetical protein
MKTVTLPSGITVPWDRKRMVWLHEACPEANQHSPFPADFNAGSGLSKTHRQAKHATCGLWALWIPKADR